MIFNMVGGGGGSSTKSTIIVSIETGSTVAAYSDSSYQTLVKTASEKTTGEYWLTGLANGTYYIKATKGSDVSTASYTITEYGVYRITMTYTVIPEFSYTGNYELVSDNDTPITTSADNWKIRFLTSGTFTITDLRGAADGVDVFLVGGGGASGRTSGSTLYRAFGGSVQTISGISVSANSPYTITIGAGGDDSDQTGGTTSGFSNSASGGLGGASHNTTYNAGYYEFGDSTYAKLYGGNMDGKGDGNTNTGFGGCNGGAANYRGLGGSGIVIIRNARS